MPEYSNIQTYIKCGRDDFHSNIEQYIRVLNDLGFDIKFLTESFSSIEWKVCDNGFVYSGCNAKPVKLDLFGTILEIKPFAMGWTPEIKGIIEPWLEVSLLFKTARIIKDYNIIRDNTQLREEVKIPLWNTMKLFSKYYNKTGVYFTDEDTDCKPWQALIGCNDDIWSFDAAIIPAQIESFYNNVPNGYIKKEEKESIYIIKNEVWGKAPWQ